MGVFGFGCGFYAGALRLHIRKELTRILFRTNNQVVQCSADCISIVMHCVVVSEQDFKSLQTFSGIYRAVN